MKAFFLELRLFFLIFFFLSLFTPNINAEGFAGNTLVQAIYGYYPIDELTKGDLLISPPYLLSFIKQEPIAFHPPIYYEITFHRFSEVIRTTQGQLFFEADTQEWTAVEYLYPGQSLATSTLNNLEIASITLKKNEGYNFYKISLEAPHTFFITRHNVLVHNFFNPFTKI